MPPSKNVESKTEDEATHIIDGSIVPTQCLFRNYTRLRNTYDHIITRSYELPDSWYFLTFKPFDKHYERDLEFYTRKGLDHCRKKIGKVKAYIITREIQATKIHINVLCVTDRNLLKLHEKKTNKYFIHCQALGRSQRDRDHVLGYILKESKTRFFRNFDDYVIKQ